MALERGSSTLSTRSKWKLTCLSRRRMPVRSRWCSLRGHDIGIDWDVMSSSKRARRRRRRAQRRGVCQCNACHRLFRRQGARLLWGLETPVHYCPTCRATNQRQPGRPLISTCVFCNRSFMRSDGDHRICAPCRLQQIQVAAIIPAIVPAQPPEEFMELDWRKFGF